MPPLPNLLAVAFPVDEAPPPASEKLTSTVNSEIFARILFLWSFADAKFREKRTLAKWRNLLFIDVGKPCPSHEFLMLFANFQNLQYLTLCMLGNFSCFCCRLLFFFSIFFSPKFQTGTLSVPNSLYQDQDRLSVSPDLGSNCLQKIISRRQKSLPARKELRTEIQIFSLQWLMKIFDFCLWKLEAKFLYLHFIFTFYIYILYLYFIITIQYTLSSFTKICYKWRSYKSDDILLN